MLDPNLGKVNAAAFAADQAALREHIAAQACNASDRMLLAPELAAINALVHELGQAGVPVEAAAILAKRIRAMERKITMLEVAQPAHMRDVERR